MFNPVDPQKDWANKIRDIVGVISIIGVVVFLFVSPVIGRSLDMVEFSFFPESDVSKNIEINLKQEGEDFLVYLEVVNQK